MKQQFSLHMAKLWSEFDPRFIDKLSYRELLWLILFMNAYHAGNAETLSIIAPESVFEEIREEAVYMTHADRRAKQNLKRKRAFRFAYTEQDYTRDSISPEDAYIEAIDNDLLFKEFAA